MHQGLDDGEDRFPLRKGHLEIDLSEFGLAIGAEILITEAADDLEVLIEAADHEELLEDLRGLRERVEAAGLYAAGNEVIARAFRGGTRHERRFDFEEAEAVQHFANGEGDLRAQDDVALHARAAQIDVTVLEARFFGDVDFSSMGKGGVRESLRIQNVSATTSTSPVGMRWD